MPRPQPQSAFHTPLNTMLGTEANVRLLRVLVLADTPVAAGELARRANLGRTSIYPALETLEFVEIVEFVGAGAQRQVAFSDRHPLARAIRALFRAEAERVDTFVSKLRESLGTLRPLPISAWLDGLDEPISLFIIGDPRELARLADDVSRLLGRIERAHHVHIELRAMTRSELTALPSGQERRLEDVVLLGGVPPVALLPHAPKTRVRNLDVHARHDEKARLLGVAVAEKLKRDPGLIAKARRLVAQRLKRASPQEQKELMEWERLLESTQPARLRRFLVASTDRATRLRQTLPVLDILSPREREAVLESDNDSEARAAVTNR